MCSYITHICIITCILMELGRERERERERERGRESERVRESERE